MKTGPTLATSFALFAALAWPANGAEPASPLLDRMAFTLGSYFTSTGTDLEVNEKGTEIGDRVNFENDLGFDDRDNLFRIGADFLIGSRHQIDLDYYDFERDSSSVLQREITIGDQVFPISAEVEGFFNSSALGASYTYWAVAKEKVTFGVSAGVQKLTFDAGVDLTIRPSIGIEPDLTVDELVPLVGVQIRTAVAKKLQFQATGRFITASDLGDIKQVDVFDFALSFVHRTFGKGGLGLAYRGFITDVEVDKPLVQGDIGYDIQGFEAFLRFWL